MIKLKTGQLPAGQGATYNAPMTLNIFVQNANKFSGILTVIQAGEVNEEDQSFIAYGNVASYEYSSSNGTDFLTQTQPEVLKSLQNQFPDCTFEIV